MNPVWDTYTNFCIELIEDVFCFNNIFPELAIIPFSVKQINFTGSDGPLARSNTRSAVLGWINYTVIDSVYGHSESGDFSGLVNGLESRVCLH